MISQEEKIQNTILNIEMKAEENKTISKNRWLVIVLIVALIDGSHKRPDTDTVGSCIAYAALLQKLGYDAKPVVLGRINNESRYVLEKANIEEPELLEDAGGCNMVLVDQNKNRLWTRRLAI